MLITPNALFHADCLEFMQRLDEDSIDLVYLDPPLPSKYFDPPPSSKSSAPKHDPALVLVSKVCQQAARILKPTGVLNVHVASQSTFSIQLMLSQVFGEHLFQDEIIWEYQRSRSHLQTGAPHHVILCYGKSASSTNNAVFRKLRPDETRVRFAHMDERGRYALSDLTASVERPALRFVWLGALPPPGRSWRFGREILDQFRNEGRIHTTPAGVPRLKLYLQESQGVPVGSIWADIPRLSPKSKENLRYPAQRPLGLIERLIYKGSNEGDMVLDPFCGSGTTVIAAERHQRKWLACDTSKNAVRLTTERLIQELGGELPTSFEIGSSEKLKEVPVKSGVFKKVALTIDDLTKTEQVDYVLNQPIPFEETRHFEFKEIKSGAGAVGNIVNASDEYAVAFLNSEGGRILWGIRDHDRVVVGIRLNYEEKDRLRRNVHTKLNTIEPRMDPSAYRLEIHPVLDDLGDKVPDLSVVELRIPAPDSNDAFYTASGEAWVKLDGTKQKLKGPTLTDFIKKRLEKRKVPEKASSQTA